MDPEKPWLNAEEFIKTLGALTAVYWKEVDTTTHVNMSKLYHVLWCAAAPDRIGWYFNNIRMRHTLPSKYLQLLGSGTSPNEALNWEINHNLKMSQKEVYGTTIDLQLKIFQEAKTVAHALAMYSPTLRQYEPVELLAASTINNVFTEELWADWVKHHYTNNGRILGSIDGPLRRKRKQTKIAIAVASSASSSSNAKRVKRAAVLKKPEAILPLKKRPSSAIKRTAFKLKRE